MFFFKKFWYLSSKPAIWFKSYNPSNTLLRFSLFSLVLSSKWKLHDLQFLHHSTIDIKKLQFGENQSHLMTVKETPFVNKKINARYFNVTNALKRFELQCTNRSVSRFFIVLLFVQYLSCAVHQCEILCIVTYRQAELHHNPMRINACSSP